MIEAGGCVYFYIKEITIFETVHKYHVAKIHAKADTRKIMYKPMNVRKTCRKQFPIGIFQIHKYRYGSQYDIYTKVHIQFIEEVAEIFAAEPSTNHGNAEPEPAERVYPSAHTPLDGIGNKVIA